MEILSGEKLKYYRKKAKLTQKKLAELSEVSASYIQKLELKERSEPSTEISIKIAKALDISIEALYPHIATGLGVSTNNFKCLYEVFNMQPIISYEVMDLGLMNEIIKMKMQFDRIVKIVEE